MQRIRIVVLALFFSILAVSGCAYKMQHFGYTREIRIGEIGCRTPFELPACCPRWLGLNPDACPDAEPRNPKPPTAGPTANGPTASGPPANGPTANAVDAPAAPRAAAPPPRLERADSNRLSTEGWVGLPDF